MKASRAGIVKNNFLALVSCALRACEGLVSKSDDSVWLCVSAEARPNLRPAVGMMNPGQTASSGLWPSCVSYSQ